MRRRTNEQDRTGRAADPSRIRPCRHHSLTDDFPDLDVDTAYTIQDAVVEAHGRLVP